MNESNNTPALLCDDVPIDILKLMSTRLFIQANSGYGKSYAMRRVLEQTAPHVQQLIIDPEGEYLTLREASDYIIAAAEGGDVLADPTTAAALAEKLMTTRASAILDLSELDIEDQQTFVAYFVESLLNLPRELWTPALVVIDEADLYCPEGQAVPSSAPIGALAKRGRKRAKGLVLGSQRISEVSKKVVGLLTNKMIGQTPLDVDYKRAAADLGMNLKDAAPRLKRLQPGEFFIFGPALASEVRQVKVGPVATTHPEPGQGALPPPPEPSEAIKQLIATMADIKPTQAEAATGAGGPDREDLAAELDSVVERCKRLETENEELKVALEKNIELSSTLSEVFTNVRSALDDAPKEVNVHGLRVVANPEVPRGVIRFVDPQEKPLQQACDDFKKGHALIADKLKQAPAKTLASANKPAVDITRPQLAILQALAAWQWLGFNQADRYQLASFARVAPKSSSFQNNLGALRSAGLIDYPAKGEVLLTDAGSKQVDWDPIRLNPKRYHWFGPLSTPQRKIIETLVGLLHGMTKKTPDLAFWTRPVSRELIAGEIGVSPSSSSYQNNLGRLRSLRLVEYPSKGYVSLTARFADIWINEEGV